MTASFRICCDAVSYRRGFIEIVPNVHPGNVNVEVWQVDPDADQSVDWVSDESISDRDVVANVELELTPSQARRLGEWLVAAAAAADVPPQSSV